MKKIFVYVNFFLNSEEYQDSGKSSMKGSKAHKVSMR